MKRILAALLLSLVALVGVSATAVAAPPKDVSYSYTNVQLTDSDGTVGTYAITASVKYNKNGTAKTTCSYYTPREGSYIVDPEGFYSVDYAIADTSRDGVLAFCKENFPNRTKV